MKTGEEFPLTPTLSPLVPRRAREKHGAPSGFAALLCALVLCWPAAGDLDAQSYPRVWSQAFPATSPPQEEYCAMTYDSARQLVVLFGGYSRDTDGTYANTWTWNGQNWSWAAVAGPGPRLSSVMSFDSQRGVCVLFGGDALDGVVSDTWEWDGSSWQLRTTNGPPAGVQSAMAYDKRRGRTVLFGGTPCIGLCGAHPKYTWEWDGQQWSVVSTDGPPRRLGAALAYDEARQQIVLFGGYDPGLRTYYSDTWTWDGTSWTQIPAAGPSGRDSHAMVYDAERKTVVLMGGYGDSGFNGETWEWDGSQWTLRASFFPPSRTHHGMAYDAARNEVVLYAGFSRDGEGYPINLHDTWLLRLAETWVDFAWPGFPIFPETGDFSMPFNTLAEGVNAAPAGSIVRIKSGSRNEPIYIGKKLYVRAYGGPAVIGR